MRLKFIFILAFSLLSGLFAAVSAQEKDIFEQFAQQKRIDTPDLEMNPAPNLPDNVLKWDDKNNKGFRPMKKINTQADLDKELSRMRKKFTPFMKDLAPKLQETRTRDYLKEFQWRLLASEMRTDGNGKLYPIDDIETVDEEWQTVTIPHYTGPINRAEGIYRKELHISSGQLSYDKLFLHFNGVDYITEVFINNIKVGSHTGLSGAFEFDIKPFVKKGKNILEVKIYNDAMMMGDNFFLGPNRKFGKKLAACGGPGWDEPGLGKGWTMCPAGFGIWQDCYMETRSSVFINEIYVRPLLEESKAEVMVEVANTEGEDIALSYSLYGQNFQSTIAKKIAVDSDSVIKTDASGVATYKFTIDLSGRPVKVWSLDEPWLYQLQVSVEKNDRLIDTKKQQFGMRAFVESETSVPKGRFFLNGKEIKLRGANMMGNLMQCVIRKDFDQLRDDILLAKIAGMTFWRMTQQPCQEEVYEYFDKLGMLAQTDMPAFNGYRKDAIDEVKPQFVETIKLIRSHPCNAVISYCNEPDFGKPMMLNREEHIHLFSSFDSVANTLHPGQITKWIDGDYINLSRKHSDHHCYDSWYGENIRKQYFGEWFPTAKGWMCSCGEFGAEGLDELSLMKKYFPDEWLSVDSDGKWDPNRIPRCQTATTGKNWLNINSESLADWIQNSREFQMWATRLFTESLRRMPKMNSFAIHLLIDAWPSSWLKAIMDTDRHAKPAYFAYMDALRPVAVNLRPDAFYGFSGERSKVAVFICNDTPQEYKDGEIRYQLEFEGKIIRTGNAKAVVPPSNPQFQGYIELTYPQVSSRGKLTLRVGFFDSKGELIHDSSFDLEVLPESDRNRNLPYHGGYPQKLIS